MKPPTSTLGKAAVAVGAVLAGSWLGAAVNSRRVAKRNPAGASAGAALGAVTGGLAVTAAGAGLAISKNDWKDVGAMTAFLGSLGFAAAAIGGIGPTDRLVEKAAGQPKALTASSSDSGKSWSLNVGDTLSVALPQAQSGYSWSWAETPAGVVSGPSQASQAAAGGTLEVDTFTAAGNGTATLTAQLVAAAGGTPSATWTATVVVGNGINPAVATTPAPAAVPASTATTTAAG